MTGRLTVLGKALAYIGDDLMDGTETEREVSAVLNALHTAIQLEATRELAQLIKPWMMGKLMEGIRGMAADDQAREDAIAGLARDLENDL